MTVVAEREERPRRGGASTGLVWIGFVLIALAGCWSLLLAWQDGLSGGRDFVQDYAAIWKIGHGGNPYEPYNDVTQALWGGPPHRGPLYSFHAPTSLPLLIWLLPIALVGGYTGAFLAWGVVSVGALWAICWLTLRALGAPRPVVSGLLAALALNLLPAVRENFEEGQLNVVVAAGMVGCWAAHRSGRRGLAGVLLGAAFALKPIPGLFFLYYLWRREWRLLVAAAATLAVLAVVGVGLSGIEGARLWATVNYPSHASVWPGYPDNASVRGFFTRIFGPSEWRPRPPYNLPWASSALWIVTAGLLTLAALAAARTRPGRDSAGAAAASRRRGLLALLAPAPIGPGSRRGDLEIAVLTVLTLLVTPIVWPHYYVVLVMPIAVVVAALLKLAASRAPATEPEPVSGAVSARRAGTTVSADPDAANAAENRRRLVPILALIALGIATAVLASAQYVEPFRRAGGQQLIALLVVYAASLVALAWTIRAQGTGDRPAAAR